jgi:cytochrome c oxidase subunit 2
MRRADAMRSARKLAAASCVIAIGGCTSVLDYMHPAGPAANALASLGWFTLALLGTVSIVVCLLVALIALRKPGTLQEHAPVDADDGQQWIVVGGFAIPAAVLAILFISATQTLKTYPMACLDQQGPGADRYCAAGVPQIRVTGHQWWFEAEYLFGEAALNIDVPTEIHVPVGRPVDIELRTRDVIHSFWLPKLHGKVDLVPGMTNHIRIQADNPGLVQGQCGEYCGLQHAHMHLQLVAQSAEEFEGWMAAQHAPAATPGTDAARQGLAVFEHASCVVCHTIRGTAAHGTVGPDLTHVASRRYIAGGFLENNTANLAAWVTHAQSLKPGAGMPDITEFTGSELRALVAYLQILK